MRIKKKIVYVKCFVRLNKVSVMTSLAKLFILFYNVHIVDLIYYTWQSCKIGISISIVQVRKLKLTEMKECVPGYVAGKKENRGSYQIWMTS